MDDIEVNNETTTELTATIRAVRRSDGERLLQDTFTLPSSEAADSDADKTYGEVVGDEETARIHLTVQNGPEGTGEFTDSADSRGIFVDIYPDEVTFQTYVA